jgi:hypothetical protein
VQGQAGGSCWLGLWGEGDIPLEIKLAITSFFIAFIAVWVAMGQAHRLRTLNFEQFFAGKVMHVACGVGIFCMLFGVMRIVWS